MVYGFINKMYIVIRLTIKQALSLLFELRQMLMTAMVLLGTSVALVGCFMPWGHTGIIPLVNNVPTSWAGIPYIEIAAYTLSACVLTLFLAVIFLLRPRTYLGMLVLFGSLAILLFSGVWIAFPSMRIVEPRLGLEWPSNAYSILYGAYVTLSGAIVASLASVLQLYRTARFVHGRPKFDGTKNSFHSVTVKSDLI